MADNVIHGTGKPRFWVGTDKICEGSNSAASATSITLSDSPDLDSLDSEYGLKNFLVFGDTAGSEMTSAKITAWNDTTDVLTVDEWSNGTPANSANNFIRTKRVDLPYCQRLTESFEPDFIVKKMLSGDIRRTKRGFYYSATLDYAQYHHKDDMEILRDLFDRNYDGQYDFTFTPRLDNPAASYYVDIDPESAISFYQLRNHLGHGGIIISIRGIERLEKIPFEDPTTTVAGAVMDSDGDYVTDDSEQFVTEDQ